MSRDRCQVPPPPSCWTQADLSLLRGRSRGVPPVSMSMTVEASILLVLDELALVNGLTALIPLRRVTGSAANTDLRHREVQQVTSGNFLPKCGCLTVEDCESIRELLIDQVDNSPEIPPDQQRSSEKLRFARRAVDNAKSDQLIRNDRYCPLERTPPTLSDRSS